MLRKSLSLPLLQQPLNLRQLRLHAVEMPLHVVDLLLGFVVDRKVDDGLVLIPRGLTVLAHHDDGRLKRGDEREDEVEQDKRLGVEVIRDKRQNVDQHPNDQEARKDDDERPAAAERRNFVGDAVGTPGFQFVFLVQTGRDALFVKLHYAVDAREPLFVQLDAKAVDVGRFFRFHVDRAFFRSHNAHLIIELLFTLILSLFCLT